MKKHEMIHIKTDIPGDCCGCASCVNICPKTAISMKSDSEDFSYPVVDESLCIKCGLCRTACPILKQPKINKEVKAFGGFASDLNEQLKSASGGVFALLAKQILSEGGYICGASFADDFSVKHIIISSENDLWRLRGSKYVQSEIGNCYSEIKGLIQDGKKVLFSGTPCQVAGLKSFLQKEYENLLTVDLICHGVPSPGVWKRYLKEISNGRKILEVNFKDKDEEKSNIRIAYGEEELRENNSENLYMRGYLKNYYVRPSCFMCRFKGIQRCSDITIGDFWGVTEYHPDFQNGKGTSAIIVHTSKGQMCFDKVHKEMQLIEVQVKELELWNENLLSSTQYSVLRDEFFANWMDKGVTSCVKDLLEKDIKPIRQPDSVLLKIISRFKSIF